MLSDSTSIKRWLSFDAFSMRKGEANPYRTDKRGDKKKPKNESKQSWKVQKFGGERNAEKTKSFFENAGMPFRHKWEIC